MAALDGHRESWPRPADQHDRAQRPHRAVPRGRHLNRALAWLNGTFGPDGSESADTLVSKAMSTLPGFLAVSRRPDDHADYGGLARRLVDRFAPFGFRPATD